MLDDEDLFLLFLQWEINFLLTQTDSLCLKPWSSFHEMISTID